MPFNSVDIQDVAGAPTLWQEIVDSSSDGWIWHTWLAHEFNLCAGEKFKAEDHSFFVYENERAVGVVPLIIQEKSVGDFIGREATYYSGFLPWPCFHRDVDQRNVLDDFAFSELERRAKAAGALSIIVSLTPPQNTGDEESRVRRTALERGYEIMSARWHFTEVTPELLSHVRSRYDYKHFLRYLDVSVAEGKNVSAELEEAYFTLHVADAGGQFRSRESYAKQADMARLGEGFYVVAADKETGAIAGMALIQVYKGAAYYGSVAVEPKFSRLCVGYQLQCRAVEELLARGIRSYDLGLIADSDPQKKASEKEKGISRFKSKISGTGSRPMYTIRKT